MASLIEAVADPREFYDKKESVGDAVKYLNNFLRYDGYKLIYEGECYRVKDIPTKPDTDKPKRGGRPKDPSLPRKKINCTKEYRQLTKLKKNTEKEALKILGKKYKRSYHTIDKWIKTAPPKID